MLHFLQYHKPYDNELGEYRPPEGNISWIVTNRTTEARGGTVWLIVGLYHPRRYFLCERFIAKQRTAHAGNFRYRISGPTGNWAAPPANEIGSAAWFPRLQSISCNFRSGLRLIKDQEIIEAFERILPS